jgi:hypothetical protein
VENGIVFHLKIFAKFLINLKIIKIIIIKSQKYLKKKKKINLRGGWHCPRRWPPTPLLAKWVAGPPPWPIWGGRTTLVEFGGDPATPKSAVWGGSATPKRPRNQKKKKRFGFWRWSDHPQRL